METVLPTKGTQLHQGGKINSADRANPALPTSSYSNPSNQGHDPNRIP